MEFRIGSLIAAESSPWESGGVTRLSLTSSGALGRLADKAPSRSLSTPLQPGRTSGLLARPLLQPAPPHIFVGTATVNGAGAPEGTVVAAWVDGEAVRGAEGAIVPTPATAPAGAGSAAEALAPLGGNLVRLWRFDPPTQSWTFFDPRPGLAELSTITEMVSGFYQVVVKENQTVTLNGRENALYAGLNWLSW